MNDELGKRMKENYEQRTLVKLPRRTYTIIRIDGKAFHTLTRGFDRPFDKDLSNIMDQTTIALCKGIQGAVLAYTQSDEISILLTDFSSPTTDAWFDGNIQKIASVSASMATAAFNTAVQKHRENPLNHGSDLEKFLTKNGEVKTALFDSRVFTIPDHVEVFNYFIWRQQDASRNSVQMAARALYPHAVCNNKNNSQLQELLHQRGVNWNDYTSGEKRGRAIVKQLHQIAVSWPGATIDATVTRATWVSYTGANGLPETPIFTQDREFLRSRIPIAWKDTGDDK